MGQPEPAPDDGVPSVSEWEERMAHDPTIPRYMQCAKCGLLSSSGPHWHANVYASSWRKVERWVMEGFIGPEPETPPCDGEWLPRWTTDEIIWRGEDIDPADHWKDGGE